MKRSRSILQELNQISVDRDRNHVIQNRGEHVINSAINLLEQIEQYYDQETARDLQNRIINSIRARDAKKFNRGIGRVIRENQSTRSHTVFTPGCSDETE